MNILIMCQGQQRRLPDLKHPKHLLKVGDEMIVARTLRLIDQCRTAQYGLDGHDQYDSVSVLGPNGLARCGVPFVLELAEPGLCVVEGLIAASRYFGIVGRRTIVLLGDVVWSRAALEAVLADRRPIMFAGTPDLTASTGEVFALAFDDPERVENLCRTCPCRVDGARRRLFAKQQGGHLRRLLWWTQDHFRLRPPHRQTWHPDVYLPITDWTDDIDTPADVARLPEFARCAEQEERQRAGWAAYLERNASINDAP